MKRFLLAALLALPALPAAEVTLREAIESLDPQRRSLALALGSAAERRGPLPVPDAAFWPPVLQICRHWGLRPVAGEGGDPAALVVLESGALPPHGHEGGVLLLLEDLERHEARLLSGRQAWFAGRGVVLLDPRLAGEGAVQATIIWQSATDDAGRALVLGGPHLPAASEPAAQAWLPQQVQLRQGQGRARRLLRIADAAQNDARARGDQPVLVSGLLSDSRGVSLQATVRIQHLVHAQWTGSLAPGTVVEAELGGGPLLLALGAAGAPAPRPDLPQLPAEVLLVVGPEQVAGDDAVIDLDFGSPERVVVQRQDGGFLTIDRQLGSGVWQGRRWLSYRSGPVAAEGLALRCSRVVAEERQPARTLRVVGALP